MPPDDGTDSQLTVARLQRRLAAQDKTIAALMAQVESHFASAGSAYATLGQAVALERVVRNKTHELETQRAELTAALEQLSLTQARLLQAEKLEAIGSLAAGIAHEINTPTQYVGDNLTFLERAFGGLMACLEEYLALLRAPDGAPAADELCACLLAIDENVGLDFLREEVPNALRSAQDGVGRISHIVRAMKEFSHPGVRERVHANLNRAIENTVTVAQGEYKLWAEVRLDLDPEVPEIPCLISELNQVILNLIVNSAHAIRERVEAGCYTRGTIVLSTRFSADGVAVRISDTGGGIPVELRSRVFDPFFTTKEVGKGTGQGLAIVHDVIVNKHGGTIELESEVGVGTTFLITLPITEVSYHAAKEKRQTAA